MCVTLDMIQQQWQVQVQTGCASSVAANSCWLLRDEPAKLLLRQMFLGAIKLSLQLSYFAILHSICSQLKTYLFKVTPRSKQHFLVSGRLGSTYASLELADVDVEGSLSGASVKALIGSVS